MLNKILICDDDADILEMMSLTLESEHLELTLIVKSVEFAVNLEKIRPDLVILDL